jgi:integrase/recombinase XerD
MVVHIYARHSPKCPHKKDPQYKRCRCPRWVTYTYQGTQHRESAKARSFEQAQVYARDVEERYARIAAGAKPRPTEAATVVSAVQAYLTDKRDQQVKPSTLRKRVQWFEKDLLAFCRANGIHFLADLDLEALRRWRSTWELSPLTAQKKQEGIRQFFKFCEASGWVVENPAKALSKIKVTPKQTGYFEDYEMEKILRAAEGTLQGKLHALILLMRWSGLAIRDACTLERERLNAQDQVFLYRAKTGSPVRVLLPPQVAQELRDLGLLPNPRYFFWSGNGSPETIATYWRNQMGKLFKKVKLINLDGTLKRAHSHMFRDTFAVGCLLHGVSMHDLSLLLGHTSIKTTERHYAPFSQARSDLMDSSVRATW